MVQTIPNAFDREQFLKRFYPVNPFDGGVWAEADKLPIEVFTACVAASVFLEDCGESAVAFKNESSKILVRVDADWYQSFLRRKKLVYGFVVAALQKSDETSELLSKYRQQLAEFDDPQLHQDLIEAQEAIDFQTYNKDS